MFQVRSNVQVYKVNYKKYFFEKQNKVKFQLRLPITNITINAMKMCSWKTFSRIAVRDDAPCVTKQQLVVVATCQLIARRRNVVFARAGVAAY